jgi:hypothetical protein
MTSDNRPAKFRGAARYILDKELPDKKYLMHFEK